MVKIARQAEVDGEDGDADFKPLTAEQAKAFREQHPSMSPWWVVLGQVAVGALVSLVAWLLTGNADTARSAACGSLAVVVPAALFARGVTGQFASVNAGSAVMSFFVWEFVKIVVTVGIMYAAHRLVSNLSWPAMLVALVLTMKVYWLALAIKPKVKAVRVETPHGTRS